MNKYPARKFNKKSYEINDSWAKDLFSTFLTRRNHIIVQSEEDYFHDLVTIKNNQKYYFELEVKTNYPFTCQADFKFPTVSFTGRKIRLHQKNPFHYVIVCRETRHALTCFSTDIYNDNYIEEININTKDRSGLDSFYRVPKHLCKFFKL